MLKQTGLLIRRSHVRIMPGEPIEWGYYGSRLIREEEVPNRVEAPQAADKVGQTIREKLKTNEVIKYELKLISSDIL